MPHKWVRDLAGVSVTGFLSVGLPTQKPARVLLERRTLILRAPFHLGAVWSRTVPSPPAGLCGDRSLPALPS